MGDLKKPSEIALTADPQYRETGRITDLPNFEIPSRSDQNRTICCCVDAYIDEEASVYKSGGDFREGDVFVHKAHLLKMTVCINVCFTTEAVTEIVVRKATDDTTPVDVRVE
jgi:hypothetical protein